MPEETHQFITKNDRPEKKSSFKKVFLLLVSYAIVALVVWQVQARFVNSPERQQEIAREEIQDVVDQVKDIMIISEDEFPQMATIDNAVDLAKTQAFFANVQNGDKVLIFVKDQKAIIYRPSTGKIVNVGPVVPDGNQGSQVQSQSQSQSQTQSQPAPVKQSTSTSSKNTSTDTDEE